MGLAEGSVKSYVHHGLRKIREHSAAEPIIGC